MAEINNIMLTVTDSLKPTNAFMTYITPFVLLLIEDNKSV